MVARLGHLTQAAERLHLSQPTVTGQIKALEEELGVRLFERTARGVKPTVYTEKLLPSAERIIEAAEAMATSAQELRQELSGKIRIGTIIDADLVRIVELSARMRTRYPHVEIEFHHGLTGWVLESLKKQTLDVGFYIGEVPTGSFVARHLQDLKLCVIAPPGFHKKLKNAGWNEISALPWIWTPKAGAYHRIASRLFRDLRLKPNVIMEADRESTLINLVAAGMGLSLTREDVARSAMRSGKIIIWDKAQLTAPLSFVALRKRLRDPMIQSTDSEIAEMWNVRPPNAAKP